MKCKWTLPVCMLFLLVISCQTEIFENGVYRNREYHFSLEIPDDWRRLSEEEAGGSPLVQSMKGLDNRLFVTPSDPKDAVFTVSVLDITGDKFIMIPWTKFVAQLSNLAGMEVQLNRKEDIGGMKVFRVGGVSEEYYRELTLFISEQRVIQLAFFIRSNSDLKSRMHRIVYSLEKR